MRFRAAEQMHSIVAARRSGCKRSQLCSRESLTRLKFAGFGMTSSEKKWSLRLHLLRLGDDSQIGLGRLPASGIFLLRFVVRDRWQNNDVAALLPVHGRSDLVFGGKLHG